jgi:S-formylglutathione hydrolase
MKSNERSGWLFKLDRSNLTVLSIVLCSLLAPRAVLAQSGLPGTVVKETVHSRSLEGNLLGDSPDRAVSVYLPPGYQNNASRYLVVYLLNGWGDTDRTWIEGDWANVPKIMDRLISSGKIRDIIVVMPDGSNRYGGSFYTNSVTTGNWEDFVTYDLVVFIDGKYRTLSRPGSRGIAGHSSGGHGALKLAMKHPDLYGAVYGISPCCMEWGNDVSLTNGAWEKTLGFGTLDDFAEARKALDQAGTGDDFYTLFFPVVFVALSASWSPNPDRPLFFVDFPVEGHGSARKPLTLTQAAWSANMPVAMLGQYRSNLARLVGIAFDVGLQDESQDIVTGARDFSRMLTRNGIHHEFEEYEGTHGDKVGQRLETKVLPFFSRVLEQREH